MSAYTCGMPWASRSTSTLPASPASSQGAVDLRERPARRPPRRRPAPRPGRARPPPRRTPNRRAQPGQSLMGRLARHVRHCAVALAVDDHECQPLARVTPGGPPVPTYQYSCTDCGHFFEIVQSFSDDSLTVCPECEGRLRKVFNAVGVVFKGSGFYRNDSRGQKAGAETRLATAPSESRAAPRRAEGSGERRATSRVHRAASSARAARRPRARAPRRRADHRLTHARGTALWIAGARPARFGLPSGAMNPLPARPAPAPPCPPPRAAAPPPARRRSPPAGAVLVGLQAASPPPPRDGHRVDRAARPRQRHRPASRRPGRHARSRPDTVPAGRRSTTPTRWSAAPSPPRCPAAR